MEIKWLKDFLVLSDAGNFRIAAEQRCVSQPAFSRRIQSLEQWAGASLFDRSNQPIKLTEAGKLFYPTAEKIITIAQTSKLDILAQITKDSEKICFATLSSLAQVFIPTWLKNLRVHSDISQFEVRTEYDTLEEYFSALEENIVDFFIYFENPKSRFHDDKKMFTSLKLGQETLVPVSSPNEKGASRWWLPDNPVEPIPCLHTLSSRSPSPIRNHMETKYGNLIFKSVYQSSISTTLKAMALEGFGLAWIPSAHIADDIKNGQLVRAANKADDIIVDISIYRCNKYSKPHVDKFWQVLLDLRRS